MPIHTAVPVRVFDQESFHRIDKRVTGLAFDIHNELGRYLDEALYQGELTRRCRAAGLEVEPEFQIDVSLGSFQKSYYADHLVERGVVVEGKAVAALGPAHKGQALNYLFLCGLHHATLLNFRTERVEHEFVSTRLTQAERRRCEVATVHWRPLTAGCRQFHDLLHQMLAEWGAYLSPSLYRDAVTHFLGGEERVVREVPVSSEGTVVGHQQMRMQADDVAFSVTASTHRPETVLDHQRRFLRHTRLRAIQWVNLSHKHIEFRTIEHR
jgi:GxxExxY protein